MKQNIQVVEVPQAWKLEDYTDGKMKGYLRITKNGRRVADVFPFAPGQDVEWTVKAAREIVAMMNERERRPALP